ncbi:MAG TPA: hypothetical protein VLY23_17910 [Candidatus Acidoferrum sp.]|nr:hypothetical protein [Candidatus Acidoferrum sp.]
MRIQWRTLAFTVLNIALLSSCFLPRAHSVVTNVTRQEHPEVINGEMDWGSEVGFDLRNDGDRGMVHITVTLTCSEGEWNRTQDIQMEAGESRHFTYFFQEPTINATNYQGRVNVEP